MKFYLLYLILLLFSILNVSCADPDENVCAICHDPMVPDGQEIVSRFVCGHKLHKDCIAEWMKRKQDCPVCRNDILTGISPIAQRTAKILNAEQTRIKEFDSLDILAKAIIQALPKSDTIYGTLNEVVETLFGMTKNIMFLMEPYHRWLTLSVNVNIMAPVRPVVFLKKVYDQTKDDLQKITEMTKTYSKMRWVLRAVNKLQDHKYGVDCVVIRLKERLVSTWQIYFVISSITKLYFDIMHNMKSSDKRDETVELLSELSERIRQLADYSESYIKLDWSASQQLIQAQKFFPGLLVEIGQYVASYVKKSCRAA